MTERAKFQLKLWGTRGGLSVSGPQFVEFGGNTTCIEMRCGDDVMMFDAGSGALSAGAAMAAEGCRDVTLFFTHTHYDHICGLPFFKPLYCKQSQLRLWSGHMGAAMTTRQMLKEFMRDPFFPIGPDYCSAGIDARDFKVGDVLTPHPGVHIQTGLLNHPGNAVGYRVEFGGRSIAIITDTEHEPGVLDPAVLRLIDKVDLFLYDATFTDAEMATYKGFGHSSWQQAVRLAQAAGAKQVGFIHHSFHRSDADLLQIEQDAKAQFAGAFCGRELQVIDL
ncbi:MBL fold metallo-hydrolase [Cypionkella aquatica]|uniref:MBL fold metallo-hydrolase n=1 Tax=Cypionkella aquatica TaxID=1756042 RepID=A0AA37TXN8_9RHOB|nr:MBL fold metallo-hydrolase [Cypionkella aquatica]GLS86352.1 MBL fold metallo-hydrolase [Cypionkella aquatica]